MSVDSKTGCHIVNVVQYEESDKQATGTMQAICTECDYKSELITKEQWNLNQRRAANDIAFFHSADTWLGKK